MADIFVAPLSQSALETGDRLTPRFDENGLIACVATRAGNGEVLMLAWMNDEALARTVETGIAHYWSRSRQKLWKKGETSGQIQTVRRLRIDCDQDAVLIEVDVDGDGGACHTGARTCFYREIDLRPDDISAATLRRLTAD